MTYIPSVNKVQLGIEAAYDDDAAGTREPPGITTCRLDPKIDVVQLKDLHGNTMPSLESVVNKRWSEGRLEGYLNYQDALWYLNGMFGLATPAGDTSTWKGDLDWDAAWVEQSYTIRYGQTGGLYLASGVLPYTLGITGNSGGVVTFSYDWFGTPITDGATFAVLGGPDTVEWVFGHDCVLYLDDGAAADPGTTPMTDLGFSFDFKITSNRKPVWHLNNQEHDSWVNGQWGGSAKLVLEADATMLGYMGDIIDTTTAGRDYAVRMRATDGSNVLDIDMVGTQVGVPNLIPDLDGVVTVELDLVPTYGSNAGMLSCWAAEITIP